MARLGDICTIQSGGTPSRGNKDYWDDGTIPWVKISDFSGKYLCQTSEKITQAGLDNSSAKIFPKGTILYTIFATLGETCILDVDAATNQAIAGLKLNDSSVSLDYLYYYLLSKKSYVNEIGRGVAQNNINMKILREMEIAIPTKEKQVRITEALNKVFELISLRKEQLAKLDELVKARFVEMFGQCNYSAMPLINFIEEGAGLSYGIIVPGDNVENGVPMIRPSDFINGELCLDNVYRVAHEIEMKYARTRLVGNEILVQVIGQPGQIMLSNWRCKGMNVTRNLAVIRPDTDKINRIYLKAYMQTQEAQLFMLGEAKQSTLKQLPLSRLKELNVPMPPLGLQEQFADFVEQTNKTKLTIQSSLDKLEVMKKALMQEYFG